MKRNGSDVRIESLSHRYGLRSPYVLHEISLEIEPGSKLALIGRSGCGKSSLLQLMSGLAQPTKGRVVIDGTWVREPSPRWNMMFQKPLLYPWMTAEKNAALGMLIDGDGGRAKRRIPELLELVGMAEFGNARVRQLSGGQQQRIALARSLATEPDLLMLDEPFAALDEVTRSAMQRDVTRITDQFGITQIIVTHDIDEAFTMADRIVVMAQNPGRIVADLENRKDDLDGTTENKLRVRKILNGALPNDIDTSFPSARPYPSQRLTHV